MKNFKFKISGSTIKIYSVGNLLTGKQLINESVATFRLPKASGKIHCTHKTYDTSKVKGNLTRDSLQLLVLIIRNEILDPIVLETETILV